MPANNITIAGMARSYGKIIQSKSPASVSASAGTNRWYRYRW